MASPPLSGCLETLLNAAVRAPSGDNTQPWTFQVDADAGSIALVVDPTRDPSPMNAGQRMARIAVGAALENMLVTAARNGWKAEAGPATPPALAVLTLADSKASAGSLDPAIGARVSNRRVFDGRPVAPDILQRLAAAGPALDGVRTLWLTERERTVGLAEVISRADALMFGERTMRQAFLGNVRFDAAATAEVDEGLSLASLELAAADRVALRLMRKAPHWLVQYGGPLRAIAGHARRLVTSAAGLCLVAAADDSAATDVLVGRALQRAWLALTAAGLAVQPMMSLPVLDNALTHGGAALGLALGRDRVLALGRQFRKLVPELAADRPAALLRFGYAAPPSGRTGRRTLESVCRSVADSASPTR